MVGCFIMGINSGSLIGFTNERVRTNKQDSFGWSVFNALKTDI